MTVTAIYQFDPDVIDAMDATIKITMSVKEWRKLRKHLGELEKEGRIEEPAFPLMHCVTNIIDAIDSATGNGYGTRGFSYTAAKQEPNGDTP